MRKILFTDMDGTLLRNDKTVSQGNRDAILRLLASGGIFVMASGRAESSGYAVAKAAGLLLPGCYIIGYNGATLYDCGAGRILERRTIPIPYVRYLFSEAKRWGLHIQTYQDGKALTERYSPELEYYVQTSSIEHTVAENVLDLLREEPCKALMASFQEERLIEFQREHLAWEQGKCCSFFSCPEYLEYCPQGTDKGAAVRRMAKRMGVPMEDTYAVGDERNDVSMLREAGTGIAVRNAHPQAMEAADWVTEHDNEHDAIAEVVERFFAQE